MLHIIWWERSNCLKVTLLVRYSRWRLPPSWFLSECHICHRRSILRNRPTSLSTLDENARAANNLLPDILIV